MNQELPTGAQHRHQRRIAKWKKTTQRFPVLQHEVWWLLHNVVSHSWLGVWPSKASVWFHDYTSQKLNLRGALRPSPMPSIPDFYLWAKHNIVAHTAIGLFPCTFTFDWHDQTAEQMKVEDWV